MQENERHLVLCQVVSAGQNGQELGGDEEQIVYLLFAILDVQQNKVRTKSFRCQITVKFASDEIFGLKLIWW